MKWYRLLMWTGLIACTSESNTLQTTAPDHKPSPAFQVKDVTQDPPRIVSRMWWNQLKKIEALGLDDEQRARMDQEIIKFLEARNDGPKRQRAILKRLGEALHKQDYSSARRHGKTLAAEVATPIELQIEMMIGVVQHLTPTQRATLIENQPRMFSRLWLRSVAGPAAKVDMSRQRKRP